LRGGPNHKVVFQSAFGCLTEVLSSLKDSFLRWSNFGVTLDWLKDGKSGLFFQVFVEDSEIFTSGNADRSVSDITIGEKAEMIGKDERSDGVCCVDFTNGVERFELRIGFGGKIVQASEHVDRIESTKVFAD
jgi:hypothetical protein